MKLYEFKTLCDAVDSIRRSGRGNIGSMSANPKNTFRVRRPGGELFGKDDRAAEVRSDQSAELELVSTQMLKQILASNDRTNRTAIEEVSGSNIEGVLARDMATGYFEIIDNDELQAILDQNEDLPKFTRPSDPTIEPLHDYVDSDHLSLVSTQALRRVFRDDEKGEKAEPGKEVNIRGFNPYDCY
jgi:hypothetical protein